MARRKKRRTKNERRAAERNVLLEEFRQARARQDSPEEPDTAIDRALSTPRRDLLYGFRSIASGGLPGLGKRK